tara:strand:- start:450 stop:818 length:369 start_codon:yes stop_codon:yes gene_type:complete
MIKVINDYDLWLKEMNLSEDQVQDIMTKLDVDYLLNNKNKKYHKEKSKIHGIGLFATNDIKKKEFVGLASFKEKRTTLGRYTNHSNKPNLEFRKFKKDVAAYALINIDKNEELLVNYRHDKL